MKSLIKFLLPIVVVAAALWVASQVLASRPEAERKEPSRQLAAVAAIRVEPQQYAVKISSYGTVAPRTETTLIPEVAGRIVSVSPNFSSGEFFERGETLLTIDPRDYEVGVKVAEAQLAQSRALLEEENARAQVSQRDWERTRGNQAAPSLVVRKPQVNAAKAAVASAGAQLERAQLDLERTRISAPYAGRVLEQNVDVGQYVSPGTVLANIYAVDYVEIRLPISNRQLDYVQIPDRYRGEATLANGDQPKVSILAEVGRKKFEWQGNVVRSEGAIDTQSRQLFLIAQVNDPYARGPGGRPPLRVGQFVEAQIAGAVLDSVFVLPRAVLREGAELLLVDSDQKLRRKQVHVLWSDADQVVVDEGLNPGDVVVTTAMSAAVDGVEVKTRIAGEEQVEQKPDGERKRREPDNPEAD